MGAGSHEEGWERADICGYSDTCGFLCIFIVAVMCMDGYLMMYVFLVCLFIL